MKDKLKLFFESNWSMAEKILLLADILLFGILLGWLTSPFRKQEEDCCDCCDCCECDCEDEE